MDDWKTLALALRTLHAALLRRARAEYLKERGLADEAVGPGELLKLATGDESFAWLRRLSELMADIDELRDSPDAVEDARLRAAVRKTVEALVASPSADAARTPFQETYWRYVHAEPEVTMAHAALRQALRAWPEAGEDGTVMASHLQKLRNTPRS